MSTRPLHIFTTGGTIDKVYFDALSEFQVGETAMDAILREANIGFDYALTSLMKKDSLELTDEDRTRIAEAIQNAPETAVLVTHGTDTMVQSAGVLGDLSGKTVVFTGAMQPASLRSTDAVFNIGFAIAATQILPAGVYIAMNGRVFDPEAVVKDRSAQKFIRK